MPIETHPARMRGRTPEQIIAEQKVQAARAKGRTGSPASEGERGQVASARPGNTLPNLGSERRGSQTSNSVVPAKPSNAAVAKPNTRTAVQQYVDEIAPASIVGRLIKFGKEGSFVTSDDGEPVPEAAEFLALCDETLVGWIKFNTDDDAAPPERVMGLLYDGFVMPRRDTLGDTDETQWEPGLSGSPEDPWHHQVCLVLQNTETKELYTFATTSQTGRRAVGNLLRHYDRMQRTNAGEVPVVRLKSGGFNHRDDRIGWVPVPVFAVIGRAPRDSAAKPDTSMATDLNDEIPYHL